MYRGVPKRALPDLGRWSAVWAVVALLGAGACSAGDEEVRGVGASPRNPLSQFDDRGSMDSASRASPASDPTDPATNSTDRGSAAAGPDAAPNSSGDEDPGSGGGEAGSADGDEEGDNGDMVTGEPGKAPPGFEDLYGQCQTRTTSQMFKDTESVDFAEMADWFPWRPLARVEALPVGPSNEVVLAYGGGGEGAGHGRAGDPKDGYGVQIRYAGRGPDEATPKEILEAGGTIAMFAHDEKRGAPGDGAEAVVVRGQAGLIYRAPNFLCYTVDHWWIIWDNPNPDGTYISTSVYLATNQFTREEALAFCEAMVDWAD